MKVAIIGAGNVGATLAYTLVVKDVANQVSLIDVNPEKALGEVLDLAHGASYLDNVDIRAEGYEGVADADVIAITAGRGRKPGESRLDLARGNAAIMEEVLAGLAPHYRGAVVIVVSNPMDVLTYVAVRRLAAPPTKIIGSGTSLDSSRFRYLLGREFDIDPRNIHAYVIGEHGDSSVPAWSMASLGQIPVTRYAPPGRAPLDEAARSRIHQAVVAAGREVIQRKGATFYAVALSVARIIEAVLDDERSVLTVSSYIERWGEIEDVCLSLPAVVGRAGIREVLPIVLDDTERRQLAASAASLREIIRQLGY
ncbi:MAG TPA: L-lactate dehydrogenase [Thermoanaerobaculaceae bacterium]|nr:L-lactate dehydrogenase [Thermoanaerobaculaceae bacterium]HRS17365.1 L-lactate dehydrogenase [Thermoanaerobaculaceae bacterium]